MPAAEVLVRRRLLTQRCDVFVGGMREKEVRFLELRQQLGEATERARDAFDRLRAVVRALPSSHSHRVTCMGGLQGTRMWQPLPGQHITHHANGACRRCFHRAASLPLLQAEKKRAENMAALLAEEEAAKAKSAKRGRNKAGRDNGIAEQKRPLTAREKARARELAKKKKEKDLVRQVLLANSVTAGAERDSDDGEDGAAAGEEPAQLFQPAVSSSGAQERAEADAAGSDEYIAGQRQEGAGFVDGSSAALAAAPDVAAPPEVGGVATSSGEGFVTAQLTWKTAENMTEYTPHCAGGTHEEGEWGSADNSPTETEHATAAATILSTAGSATRTRMTMPQVRGSTAACGYLDAMWP